MRTLDRIAPALLFLCASCSGPIEQPTPEPKSWTAQRTNGANLTALVANEELLIELGQVVSRIEDDLSEGGLPGPNTTSLLDPDWLAGDLESAPSDNGLWSPLAPKAQAVGVWSKLLQPLGPEAQIDISLPEGEVHSPSTASTLLVLRASGRTATKGIRQVTARARLSWSLTDGEWAITRWESLSAETGGAAHSTFEEVLAQHSSPDLLQRARRSAHEEQVLAALTQPYFSPPPHFQYEAFDQHPGIAVADIDGDGRDELFLGSRHGKNMVLRDRGDGIYEDVAGPWGLDSELATTSALFIDLDNDGDLDAVLAHWAERSEVLEQRGGRFHPKPSALLPRLVSSISAADVDGDGNLDLHFSTYAASAIEKVLEFWRATGNNASPALEPFLPAADAEHLAQRLRSDKEHFFLSRSGPPNVLLKNDGAFEFKDITTGAGLHLFQNTYQAGFADIDLDGDPDLYLANDFAPNHLLRNDGGRFTKVEDSGPARSMGLGMGVAWGDVDRDGRVDLYVSNMDSKAGRRITGSLDGLDPRVRQAALGGQLLVQDEAGFRSFGDQANETPGPTRAGWSWGGSFGDFDNDGWLDLYVPSGYYSSPADDRSDVDT